MMKRTSKTALFCAVLLLLTACKREGTDASAEAEALDYVKLVQVALSNAHYESGKPVPATPCTDKLFGMKKTSKFLKLKSCTAKLSSDNNFMVAATFNDDLAILGDSSGTKRVKVSELPAVQ